MNILVTGGAGYIGSLLCGILLERGHTVQVLDDLLFGGDALMGYLSHPRFCFRKVNICDREAVRAVATPPDVVVHLAAIVGFPACQQVGKQVAWTYNVEGTRTMFALAEEWGAQRFVFSSTYSNYGIAPDGLPVTEESPLHPQSLYAETKIAAEQFLVEISRSSKCAPIVFRFATLFGISPRTRFDLIINQFVLEAIQKRKLVIYQQSYNRSFVHIRDIARALLMAMEVDLTLVRGQVFNVGSNEGNYSKDELIRLIQRHVDGVKVEYKDLTFGGDMRDIRVSFDKIRTRLGYTTTVSVEEGIKEVAWALTSGFLADPQSARNRNAQFIVQ